MAENLSSNEVLESIQDSDTTVEVIGYVDQIVTPYKSEGTRNLRFILNNGEGRRIQVIAWNDMIERVEKIVTSVNLIIHVNGASAHIPRDKMYNKGNVHHELLVTESTSITALGVHEVEKKELEIPRVKLEDCAAKIGTVIKVKAFMSCTFGIVQAKNYTFCVGSVTDGHYKLELRSKEDLCNLELAMGSYVEVTGRLEKQSNGFIQLKVNSLKDIEKLKGKKMRFENILMGYHNIV